MKELIKSEAEKYAICNQASHFRDFDKILETFSAGFNRCLELAKRDSFEVYESWSKSYFGHSMPPSQNYYEATMNAFNAAAKLKDCEIMELKETVKRRSDENIERYLKERELEEKLKELEYQLEQQKSMNPISVNMIATISELSEKLKVAVEALEYFNNPSIWGYEVAQDTLEKIKGEK